VDAPELPFEYCALKFLLQWEQKEKALHKQIADATALPGETIRAALKYFQVARTFPGGITEEAAEFIAEALLQVDNDPQFAGPEKKVRALALQFKEKFRRYNLSAASKLFWLRHRQPYIICDGRAVTALRDLGCKFKDRNYGDYCKSWRQQYSLCQSAIRQAASRLSEVKTFVPHQQTEAELTALAAREWFLERVFDIYLWELGAEG